MTFYGSDIMIVGSDSEDPKLQISIDVREEGSYYSQTHKAEISLHEISEYLFPILMKMQREQELNKDKESLAP